MNKFSMILPFIMGVVVLASNYLVQFPIKHYGLEEILTYGAFSYPVAFLIKGDLINILFFNFFSLGEIFLFFTVFKN